MANKPTQPIFPLGLETAEQSKLAGVLNTGVIEHGPDAVMTVPEGNAVDGLPSAVRYNATSDEFEGYYENGGWLPLGGGGVRWEVLPHASTATLEEGRGYLVDNSSGISTVVFPTPTRVGDSVTVCDMFGKFSVYPLTIDPNGHAIYGSTEPMTLSTDSVSATFTWSGDARGWIVTAGVGLGQGRVYSRTIFTTTLAVDTTQITLATQPSIVDVYVDGKRLLESKYSLDGYNVNFSPALTSGSEVQIIQYVPIQLGVGGGGSSSTVITWVYNSGSAAGGETTITLDVDAEDVTELFINGTRQQKNLGFQYDSATKVITLADELDAGDEVVVVINGDPTLYNQIDRTPNEVARAANVPVSQVILSSDTITKLNGKTVIYDVAAQKSWGLPAGIPTTASIVSVTGNQLTYVVGSTNTTVTLLDVAGSAGELKKNLAAVDGISMIGMATYAQIRAYTGSATVIQCVGRSNIFDNAQGLFSVVSGDTTTVDDDGVFLVDTTGRRWKRTDTTKVVPEWWGAKSDGVANATPGINAAIQYLKGIGGGVLNLLRGTYLCSAAIDLKGAWISLKGEGQMATVVKANYTGESLVDLYETADARLSPITISDLTLNGNATIQRVMKLRYRHYTKFNNVLFTGGASAGAYAVDAWLNTYMNCGFESSNFGLHLDGANHRTACYSCSFQGCTNRCIVVRSNAAAGDGNTALYFTNCDVEFSSALGIDFQGTDATFEGCYLGENLTNSVIQVYSGTVRINGGVMFFGYTAATYLAFMSGGTLLIEGATINGQSFGSLATLAQGAGGKMAIKNSPLNFPMGGNPSMVGDVLLNMNDKKVFAPRLGIDYTSFGINTTFTESVSGSSRTVTAATVPGPTPVFGLRATLTDMQWRDAEKWAVVVSYSSNVDFNVRVAAAAGGSGTFIGTLPATGGVVKTAVLYGTSANRTAATVFEVYRDGVVAVGHTITLRDISFGDSRAMGLELGSLGSNIYKF